MKDRVGLPILSILSVYSTDKSLSWLTECHFTNYYQITCCLQKSTTMKIYPKTQQPLPPLPPPEKKTLNKTNKIPRNTNNTKTNVFMKFLASVSGL